MSKIYEALRQHEQTVLPMPAPFVAPAGQEMFDGLSAGNRDMQSLYHSIEAALGQHEGGAMLLFSSAHAGEGKTTIVGGFATTAAGNFGRSVLILDGDRQGALCRRFTTGEAITLNELAQAPEAVLQRARRLGPRGSVAAVAVGPLLGVGAADTQGFEILAAAKTRLKQIFDFILIDSPSLAQVPWSPVIGKLCDGVVLIVEAERTRSPVILHAKQEFENSGAKVLGVFLNKRRLYIPRRVYRYL
jgi:Mrp family chromosome partitioning ATPase